MVAVTLSCLLTSRTVTLREIEEETLVQNCVKRGTLPRPEDLMEGGRRPGCRPIDGGRTTHTETCWRSSYG